MPRTANPWDGLADTRQPQAPKFSPKKPGWLESLRQALARQRRLDEEALRLQIRRRPRS